MSWATFRQTLQHIIKQNHKHRMLVCKYPMFGNINSFTFSNFLPTNDLTPRVNKHWSAYDDAIRKA